MKMLHPRRLAFISLDGGTAAADADWANRRIEAATEVTVEASGFNGPVSIELPAEAPNTP